MSVHFDKSAVLPILFFALFLIAVYVLYRRREKAMAALGYVNRWEYDPKIAGMMKAFTGMETGLCLGHRNERLGMALCLLRTAGDEAPIYCAVAGTGKVIGGRIVFLKAYGNRTLLGLVDKIGGGMQDGEYAKHGLKPLEAFNEKYIPSHGIKAYADHAPDMESPLFISLFSPVIDFTGDAAGAAYADGYVFAWCGGPENAHRLCERMYEAAQRAQIG